MKKNLFSLIACVLSFCASAQTTVNIYATGAAGSYTTGNSTNSVRNDNNIVTTAAAPNQSRGYAVFDLASLPASAVITNVELHYNMAAVTGPAVGSTWDTRGYVGDLSTITVPGTLYTTMGLAPSIWTTPYPTMAGNAFMASNAASVNFVSTNIGIKVSVVWSTNSVRTYNITGETGTATPSGTHAPYLAVTYNCPGISSITASGPATNPCPNASFALSGSATGTIASYSWNGPLGFSSSLPNPTVTSGLPSSGTYTLTVTDATGCSASATTVVVVNPTPVADIVALTSTAFCDGGDATLEAAVPGLNYQWYEGTTAIAGATNQSYTTTITGNYKVRVTDAIGCSALTTVATPTVLLSTPAVNPGDTVLLCSGDNGTVTVNTNGITSGITFQWQKNGVDIPAAMGSSYLVSATGVYKCVLSVPAIGCTTTSEEVVVTVNDYPLPAVSYSGTTLSTGIYSQYQWFLNTVAIPGATNQTYHPTSAGSYRVRVKDAAGCTAFSPAYAVNTASAVGNITAANIKLYPNPVNNMLHIEAPVQVKALISSAEGKTLCSNENAETIDLSAFTPGLYIITIYDGEGNRITTQKVVKQ